MAIEQIRIKNAGGSYTTASLGAETNDIKVSGSNVNLTATLSNLYNSINNKVDKVENASLMTQQEHNKLANLENDYAPKNHAAETQTYGVSSDNKYGHTKIFSELPPDSNHINGGAIVPDRRAAALMRYYSLPQLKDGTENTASSHNSIYRGADLLSIDHFNNNLDLLYTSIFLGDFQDIYVGDYFTTNNGFTNRTGNTITWVVAAINYDLELNRQNKNHIILVPKQEVCTIPRSESNYKGYCESEIYHYYTNIMNRTGISSIAEIWEGTFGYSSHTDNFVRTTDMFSSFLDASTQQSKNYLLCPLSEVEIFGSTLYNYDTNDYGYSNCTQLPLFRYKRYLPETNADGTFLLTRPSSTQLGEKCMVLYHGKPQLENYSSLTILGMTPKVVFAPNRYFVSY